MPRVWSAISLLPVFWILSESRGPNITAALEGGIVQEPGVHDELNACQDFLAEEGTTGSGWLLEDCIDVWKSWASTIATAPKFKEDNRQFFVDVADGLRQRGTPCYAESPVDVDGAGSRTMRYLATWIFAEQMGCDCLMPTGYQAGPSTNGTLYCHRSNQIKNKDYRCVAVDWIRFFNMSDHMKPFPDDAQPTTTIEVTGTLANLRQTTRQFLRQGSPEEPPSSHLVLSPEPDAAYFASADMESAEKRETVRNILERMRTSFRWSSLPSDQVQQYCDFEPSRPNIALHVRLGDRATRQTSSKSGKESERVDLEDYFDKLEHFMDTVSAAALRHGHAMPVFHIFSETLEACPSTETKAFDEFLRWPVEVDQIAPCMEAVTPDECWEKTQGAPSCPSPRSGVFRVQGEPMYLHLGLDVENAMSCMIEADGILMGCSTFGQAAGLYSGGLRFFSVGCEGWLTARHYKMIPPMAIAERGNGWIPVNGSWRDPVIYSETILDAAISQMNVK